MNIGRSNCLLFVACMVFTNVSFAGATAGTKGWAYSRDELVFGSQLAGEQSITRDQVGFGVRGSTDEWFFFGLDLDIRLGAPTAAESTIEYSWSLYETMSMNVGFRIPTFSIGRLAVYGGYFGKLDNIFANIPSLKVGANSQQQTFHNVDYAASTTVHGPFWGASWTFRYGFVNFAVSRNLRASIEENNDAIDVSDQIFSGGTALSTALGLRIGNNIIGIQERDVSFADSDIGANTVPYEDSDTRIFWEWFF